MVDYKKAAQKSILDSVIGDLNRFANVVGTADKANIEAHLGYVRDIETGLAGVMGTGMGSAGTGPVTMGNGAACGVPTGATATGSSKVAFHNTDNIPMIAKLHMDLTIAAFAADLTRVAVMQIGDQGAAHLILSWPPCNYKSGGPNPGRCKYGRREWLSRHRSSQRARQSRVRHLVPVPVGLRHRPMKSIVDPSGKSMLDSSVVVGMNNMRTGTHETTGVPVVMAGSCGGYFKTGRSLALPPGTPNNGLLVALCNAMGAPDRYVRRSDVRRRARRAEAVMTRTGAREKAMKAQKLSRFYPGLAALISAAVAAACTGTITDAGGGSATTGTRAGSSGASSSAGGSDAVSGSDVPISVTGPAIPESAGALVMRRLTYREYDHMMAELLGDTTSPASGANPWSPDAPAGTGFITPNSVSSYHVVEYNQTADALVDTAVQALAAEQNTGKFRSLPVARRLARRKKRPAQRSSSPRLACTPTVAPFRRTNRPTC